jgi:hypothetical protein
MPCLRIQFPGYLMTLVVLKASINFSCVNALISDLEEKRLA